MKEFKLCSEEEENLRKLVFVVKLDNPTVSFGNRKKISIIKNKLKIAHKIFNNIKIVSITKKFFFDFKNFSKNFINFITRINRFKWIFS